MSIEERIVWQPLNLPGSFNFAILLDRKFAAEMLSVKLDGELRQRMNELVQRFTPRNKSSHIQFFEDTALVVQFDLGGGGKWLAANETYGKNPLEVFKGSIKYSSHNIDTSIDAYELMGIVDTWVHYSDALKDMAKKT